MITQEQLDADKAAVDAAQAKLVKDQDEFEAAQPHLSVLAEIEGFVGQIVPDAQDAFRSAIAKARSLL